MQFMNIILWNCSSALYIFTYYLIIYLGQITAAQIEYINFTRTPRVFDLAVNSFRMRTTEFRKTSTGLYINFTTRTKSNPIAMINIIQIMSKSIFTHQQLLIIIIQRNVYTLHGYFKTSICEMNMCLVAS